MSHVLGAPQNSAKVLAKVALASHPAPGHAMGKGLPGPLFVLGAGRKPELSNMFEVTFNDVIIRDWMRRRALSWTIETPEGRRMTPRPEHFEIDI